MTLKPTLFLRHATLCTRRSVAASGNIPAAKRFLARGAILLPFILYGQSWLAGQPSVAQTADSASPNIGWFHVYGCGEYRVTVSEPSVGQFRYAAKTETESVAVDNGERTNTGYSWTYTFRQDGMRYELEDAWGSDGGWAELRTYRNGQYLSGQNCQK